LLKLKSDTSDSLYKSHFSKYIGFSNKNDPFLVYPSIKHSAAAEKGVAQGGGIGGLKKLKQQPSKQGGARGTKLVIPLPN